MNHNPSWCRVFLVHRSHGVFTRASTRVPRVPHTRSVLTATKKKKGWDHPCLSTSCSRSSAGRGREKTGRERRERARGGKERREDEGRETLLSPDEPSLGAASPQSAAPVSPRVPSAHLFGARFFAALVFLIVRTCCGEKSRQVLLATPFLRINHRGPLDFFSSLSFSIEISRIRYFGQPEWG